MSEKTAIEFSAVPESLEEQFKKDFPFLTGGLVRGNPGRFVLSPLFPSHVEEIASFLVRPDDTWVISFPKCGTTWMQELVWLVSNCCDFEGAKQSLSNRVPFFEFPYMPPKPVMDELNRKKETGQDSYTSLRDMDQMKSPRILKSHLPFNLLPPNLLDIAKVVYIARNPKDVIVSYFFHHKLVKFSNFTGDLDSFAEYFMRDEVYYSPFFSHLLEAWNSRHNPNLLFVFYEDLKKDLRVGLERVAEFLGKPLNENQLEALAEHLNFETMSKNQAVNKEVAQQRGFFNAEGRFMRKGETGDWKNHFSPTLNAKIDDWIAKSLDGSDLKFIDQLTNNK